MSMLLTEKYLDQIKEDDWKCSVFNNNEWVRGTVVHLPTIPTNTYGVRINPREVIWVPGFFLRSLGHPSDLAPVLNSKFREHPSDKGVITGHWEEDHSAYNIIVPEQLRQSFLALLDLGQSVPYYKGVSLDWRWESKVAERLAWSLGFCKTSRKGPGHWWIIYNGEIIPRNIDSDITDPLRKDLALQFLYDQVEQCCDGI